MSATMTMKKSRCAVDEGESRHEVDEVKSRCMAGKGSHIVREGSCVVREGRRVVNLDEGENNGEMSDGKGTKGKKVSDKKKIPEHAKGGSRVELRAEAMREML